MKRLCIFVIYDPDGMIEDYVIYLLKSLLEVTDDIYIVVNGELENESRKKLLNITTNVIQRKNTGFDAGAYKFFFEEYSKEIDWNQYDELMLVNDTFYGPFGNWGYVFHEMQNSPVDFWGLSRYKEACVRGELFREHIQSYFLVIRKSMFMSKLFMKFWLDLPLANNIDETVQLFEIGFTQYFKSNGFTYSSYLDKVGGMEKVKPGENVTIFYAADIIKTFRFPIIKRKAIWVNNYIQAKEAMPYIENAMDYDIQLIKSDIEKRRRLRLLSPFTKEQLEDFVNGHDGIYLYGHGLIAKNLQVFLSDKSRQIKGYVVTKRNENDPEDVVEFQDFKMKPEDGVIVALGKVNTAAVLEKVEKRYGKDQVLSIMSTSKS